MTRHNTAQGSVRQLRDENARRTRAAAAVDVQIARRALVSDWPASWPPRWRAVVAARAANPGWTWAQIGDATGSTKDQAVAIFRRFRAAAGEGHDRTDAGTPLDMRVVSSLYYQQGLTGPHIAAMLGTNQERVYRQMQNAGMRRRAGHAGSTGALLAERRKQIELAGRRDAELAALILSQPWPDAWPARWRAVAAARVGNPGATWQQVSVIAGLSRDQAYGMFRYLKAKHAARHDPAPAPSPTATTPGEAP